MTSLPVFAFSSLVDKLLVVETSGYPIVFLVTGECKNIPIWRPGFMMSFPVIRLFRFSVQTISNRDFWVLPSCSLPPGNIKIISIRILILCHDVFPGCRFFRSTAWVKYQSYRFLASTIVFLVIRAKVSKLGLHCYLFSYANGHAYTHMAYI